MALQDDRKNNADGHCDWEQNLPEFLQESIQAMVSAWDKLDRGEEYYVYMLRCTPVKGDYQFYIYCYQRKPFEKAQKEQQKNDRLAVKKRAEPER